MKPFKNQNMRFYLNFIQQETAIATKQIKYCSHMTALNWFRALITKQGFYFSTFYLSSHKKKTNKKKNFKEIKW